MTGLRILGLVGLVFLVTLPFNYYLKNGLPGPFGMAIGDDDYIGANDDPVVDELCMKGMMYVGNKKYDRAITAYSEAIKRDPKYPYAYLGRGDAYEAKGDLDRAIADFDQALRLDPKNQEAKVRAEMAREERASR